MHFSPSFVALLASVLATSVQAANIVKQKVVFSAAGANDEVGNGFGCVNIRPAGQVSQLACIKHVFTDGFTVGVTPSDTKKITLCSIQGAQGACGAAGVSAQVDLTGGTGNVPAASGPAGTTTLTPAELSNKPIAKRANIVKQKVVFSATGANDVVGNGFGCVNIRPAGQVSQLACIKHVFTDGFTVGVTPSDTKQITLCSISGAQGACGAAGVSAQVDLTGGTGNVPASSGPAGTTTLTPAELSNKPIAKRANIVKQKVVFSATGANDEVGNGFGCVNIRPAGQVSQLACIKHVFTDGFTVGVTPSDTKKITLCSIAGAQGSCGAAGVSAQVDLTGGTGNVPAASGPAGTTTLTPAELSNLPIAKREHARDFLVARELEA
ncbi:hypothetical protein BD410DRAFT_790575 [Rickenella mellea]|uniref:Uncharacterized protein n=1 Tax=Rickenella mellea TaxID=50990 RepID=A0A4Y7Q006_9AGAM|nr:hypothetical protein BD410DRAFT_790575 [Rickenella mellea]